MAIVVISATIAFVRSNSRNAISAGMSTAVLTSATLARARALATGAAARGDGGVVTTRGSGNAAQRGPDVSCSCRRATPRALIAALTLGLAKPPGPSCSFAFATFASAAATAASAWATAAIA
jgi:hypothetical protein